ncbi:MAG: ATP-binding protein [Pseudomonadota bacterium]
MIIAELTPEWRRLELLCSICQDARRDKEPSDETLEQLRLLQDDVVALRASQVWEQATGSQLTILETDILAATVAMEVSPNVSYAYQTLGPDASAPGLSIPVLQSVLSLGPEDLAEFNSAISLDGRLRREKLLTVDASGAVPKLLPGQRARSAVFGTQRLLAPPGTSRVDSQADWSDLVLPAYCLRSLREFLSYLTHGDVVTGDWAGKRRGGPVALFSGPSGTGKTLAASVIANAVGWPLYRVDLGALVSKYIGETEKNLNALFDAADGAHMVLLFDEADTLFGKRGDVKDARDRYANMEVSHLLSRIENQNGPCILTTNLRSHLDVAFLRRFQVVAQFAMPDAAARSRLWPLHIPGQAPLADDVDIAMLAAHATLSGAGIENAALHAAHLAAASGQPVSMRHLATGVLREQTKDGSQVTLSDLGPLAAFLREEHDDQHRQAGSAVAA